jgi:O-antigen/teichoic acid export membrane protein
VPSVTSDRASDAPRRIAGGAIVALAGSAVSFLVATAYQVLIARRLGAEGLGVFVLTLAVSTFLAEACDLGLDYGVLRFGGIAHGARDPGRLRAVVQRGLLGAFAAGSVAAALLAAGASQIARVFGEPAMVPVLLPLACAIPFTGTSEVARASLRAMGRAVPSVASDSVITPVVRLASGLVALAIAADPRHVAIGYAATEVVVLLATLAMLVPLLPRSGLARPPTGLFRFSLPMSLNRVLLYTNNQTEIFILGLLQPAGPVGVFGVARRLSTLLGSLLASITVLFNPMVADLHHRGDHEELDRLFKTATRWLFTMAFPLCLIELVFARDLLHLFGRGFAGGASALAVLALGQLVNVGTGTVTGLLAMIGRARLSVLNSLFFLGLSLVLDFLLIPRWGILGAAIANASALAAVNLLRLVQVHHALGISPYDHRFLRPLGAGLAAVAVAWLLPLSALDPLPRLGLRALVLGGVYLVSLLALGIEPGDREVARALRQRLRRRPGADAQTAERPAPLTEGVKH